MTLFSYLLIVAGTLFLVSALLMWLWNITIPRIFNVREITYWEAFRLIIIAGILFGRGFGINIGG
ncbi:MAG: hypothetical protein GX187_09010 [Clostridiaceae bacterium]|nr:hypothetical protein [Clostridiaceae bacterium]